MSLVGGCREAYTRIAIASEYTKWNHFRSKESNQRTLASENVSQMSTAIIAHNLSTNHAMTMIIDALDLSIHSSVKRGPA
jgi:uncharacterized membrane protein